MNVYDVIRRPLITEKAHGKREAERTLCFEVHPDANKIQIKQAVEQAFDVTVLAVNTMNVRGKERRRSRRTQRRPIVGHTPGRKKAVITLAEGDTIDLFGQV